MKREKSQEAIFMKLIYEISMNKFVIDSFIQRMFKKTCDYS